MAVSLIYDPAYLKHNTGEHPENHQRLEAVISALQNDDTLWRKLDLIRPKPASNEDIARCHDPDLADYMKELCESGAQFVDADTRVSPDSFEVALLAAGGAIAAVDCAMQQDGGRAFSAVRPPGHHASRARSMGFCLFNNAAVAARYAQARYGAEYVLIVDWDVHHGNGTQEIFWTDPGVFYFSTHQYPYYPGTGAKTERGGGAGEGSTLNVPLRAGTSARDHLQAFRDALVEIEKDFHPDLIVVSAGFDSRRGDPLGGLMLDDSDFAQMTADLLHLADKYAAGRVIGLLEGGYNLDLLGGSVKSHVGTLT